jgi:serine/threonine-protein kinase
MAPEQAVDASVADARSDQYSVAATLYYLLTGSLVHRFPSVLPDRHIRTLDDQQSLWALQGAVLQTTQEPDPIASHRTDISPALWKAIQKALSFQPKRRFKTCGDFADALRQAIGAN